MKAGIARGTDPPARAPPGMGHRRNRDHLDGARGQGLGGTMPGLPPGRYCASDRPTTWMQWDGERWSEKVPAE